MRRTRQGHRDALTPSTTLPQTDLGAYDPPRVPAHRPVKRWEERQGEALANQTALLNAWQQMAESIGGLLVLTRANAPGDAIGTGSQLIGPAGVRHWTFPANFQSVAVANFSGSPMTVAAAPPQSQAPTVGPGVYVVPAGAYRVVPLRGAVITIYGPAGAPFDLTTYSKPRPMDFAAIGAAATQPSQTVTPANPAAGANFAAVLSASTPTLVQAVQYTLTTSVAVANRQGGVLLAGSPFVSPATQPASIAAAYAFQPGVAETSGAVGAGQTVTYPLPPGIVLPAGGAVASDILNLQAADQISGIAILFQLQPL